MNTLLEKCPLCESGLYHSYLNCKDFTVSSEEFTIVSCDQCGFKFTNPRPDVESTGKYYESEEYISHSNKGTDLVNTVYKFVRQFTLKGKRNLVNRVSKQKGRILDIGCGTGEFLHTCQENGWKVQGVEPSASARHQAENLNKTTFHNSLFKLNADKPAYDVITMWHVLEHVLDLNKTIKHLRQLLKADGTLIVAVPNHTAWDAQHYKEFWAAYDVPRHLYHFSRESMTHLMEKHQLRIEEVIPMKLDAFYVSLLSEKYKYGKQNYIKAIINGLKSNQWAKRHNKDYSSLIYIIRKQ